jgi:hypothetical protein
MSSNTEFDELFALRILLQDEFENESDIIRELNYELIQKGTPVENIPNYLKQFYEAFGINMTLDQINEALAPTQEEELANQLINAVNQLLNVQVQQNQNAEPDDEENQDEENDEDIAEDDDESLGSDNQENQDISGNVIDVSNNTMNPPSVVNIQGNSNIQFYFSTMGPGGTIQYTFNGGNAPNIGSANLNTLLGSLLNPNPSMILPPLPPQQMMMQPLLGPLFTGLLPPGPMGPILQDVVSTLDESEKDKLKVYKLSEKKEEKCSVCMTDMNTDEQVCELPCGHTFHDDCIQPWLKEYNYKCPICRKEVGKPKHNV